MSSIPVPKISIAEKMLPVLKAHRYKVLYGGRAGMRSWTIARLLLAEAIQKPLTILCVREVQKSIKSSVHKLLRDQIIKLGLQRYFKVLETEIRGVNGSEFIFAGLSDMTADSIKSYEGVDRCWCEEAHLITKRSWDILIPTIRKPGSQVLVSFNPELETDETYQRFIVNPPDDCLIIFSTFRDNPWHSKESEDDRLKCQRDDPDNYPHIWEGKCKPAVEGAIFFKEIQAAKDAGRICKVPHDPMLRVHVVVDLGKGDSLFTSLVQRHLSSIRVIKAFQGGHFNWHTWTKELRDLPYLINGRVYLPHDGFTSTMNGPSAEFTLKTLNWDVVPKDEIIQLGVEEGIRHTRLKFAQMYFDEVEADPLIESFKRYRRQINQKTQAAGSPVADEWAHGADCGRYIAINADNMTNDVYQPNTLDISAAFAPRDAVIGI